MPANASARAIPSPMPLVDPVTIAAFREVILHSSPRRRLDAHASGAYARPTRTVGAMYFSEIQAFISGFPNFITQFGVAMGLFVVGLTTYVLLTPHKELALIRDGNASASLAFGAVVVGLAIPLGACLAHSLSLIDLTVWGTVTLLVQLIVFRVVDIFLRGLPRRIAEGDVAAAIFLMAVKLGVGIILAGALSDPSLSLFRSVG
jgi:putative membrane protein